MKISKVVFLIGAFLCAVARADTPDFMDAQIAELTARRDALRAEIESCENNTHGYKIAGIATLAATGVGVVGNIALHNKIKEVQKGGTHSGSSGGSGVAQDTRSTEQKVSEECQMFCADMPEEAAGMGCEC